MKIHSWVAEATLYLCKQGCEEIHLTGYRIIQQEHRRIEVRFN